MTRASGSDRSVGAASEQAGQVATDVIPRRKRRVSAALIDQLLSSTSNVMLTFMAARILTEDLFGAFSFALVAALLAIALGRAVVNETLLVRIASAGSDRQRQMAVGTGAAVVVAVPLGLICLVVGGVAQVAGSTIGPPMLVLGLVLPFVLVQDTVRYVSLVTERPAAAIASDGVWLVLIGAGLVAIEWTDALQSPAYLLLLWGVTGALAALLGLGMWRARPEPLHGCRFLERNKDMSVRYTLDAVGSSGSAQASYFAVSAVSGLSSLGAIKGAQTLFGPLNVLFSGLYIAVVPEAQRLRERGFGAVRQLCALASAAMAAIAALCLVVLLALPDQLGRALLGETWSSVTPVLVPLGISTIIGGAMSGALAGLRALDDPKAVLGARLYTIPVVFLFPVVGALVDDAVGMAWGLAASTAVSCAIYWFAFERAGTHSARSVGDSAEAAALLDQEIGGESVLEGVVLPTDPGPTLPAVSEP